MFNDKSITEEIEKSVTAPVSSVFKDIAEISLDTFMKEGFAKDIPILNSISNIYNASVTISNYLFTRKLIKFLNESNQISQDERKQFVEEINSDLKIETKVGLQVMMLIDRADEEEKASIIGKLYSSAVVRKIEWIEFKLLANIVNRASFQTLDRLKKNGAFGSQEYLNELLALGLVNLKLIEDKTKSQLQFGGNSEKSFNLQYEENNTSFLLKRNGL